MPEVCALILRRFALACVVTLARTAVLVALFLGLGLRLTYADDFANLNKENATAKANMDKAKAAVTLAEQKLSVARANTNCQGSACQAEIEKAEQELASANTRYQTFAGEYETTNLKIEQAHTANVDSKSSGSETAGRMKAASDQTLQTAQQFNFGRNSLGKAGAKVEEAIPTCGTGEGQARCEGVARSIEGYSQISDYADYAGYAAVAGTVLPAIIASPDQKKDLENAAKIQEVAGYVNLAAGAVDLGIGAKARFGDARELDKIQAEEKRKCQIYIDAPNYKPTGSDDERRGCEKFRGGRMVKAAAEDVRGASTTHFIMGGLKAAGGAASLYLASQNRQSASNLGALEASNAAAAANTAGTVSLGPTAGTPTNNTVGFIPTEATSTVTATTTNVPRTPNDPGASMAPSPRRNDALPPGYARRGGATAAAKSGSAGGSGGGKLGGLSGASAEGAAGDPVAEAEEKAADWGPGGGSMNRGGMDLGGGDGGFGNLLGSIGGMLGGAPGAPAANGVSVGGRGPASEGGQYGNAESQEDPNVSLFDRISGAIDRQVRAGQIVNSVNDVNKI